MGDGLMALICSMKHEKGYLSAGNVIQGNAINIIKIKK